MADLLHPDETEQDEEPETPVETGEFVVALAAEDQLEADLLVSACEEAGIAAIVQSPRSGPVGTIASPVDGHNILVPRKDLDRALVILEERRAALRADPEGAARAAEEEEAKTENH
ncbi:MAG TPA: hypothetical protein VFE90_06255 [Myxococcales bacterium]|jgi:hypothetical protein|nr:hypothetical protein [Myxococcales bacterium]